MASGNISRISHKSTEFKQMNWFLRHEFQLKLDMKVFNERYLNTNWMLSCETMWRKKKPFEYAESWPKTFAKRCLCQTCLFCHLREMTWLFKSESLLFSLVFFRQLHSNSFILLTVWVKNAVARYLSRYCFQSLVITLPVCW